MNKIEMEEFVSNIRFGNRLSSKRNEKPLRGFNKIVDNEANNYIIKFGKAKYHNLDGDGVKKLGDNLISNSKRYLLLGVLGTLTSTLTTAKTFADGVESLSEKDSPFGNAVKAANMGDFYKFEKYVYGDGGDMMDTSHVYGYAVDKMKISPYVAGLGWPHYYEAMRASVVNAKKKEEYIDSLNTVNDENSDGGGLFEFSERI